MINTAKRWRVREESWTTWQCFPATMTDDQIKAVCSRDFDFENGYESGPGQAYYNRAILRRGPFRVLVYMKGGLDV